MKNRQLALLMAAIMCFSFVFGAAAATEGEQVMPSTSVVSPTAEEDIGDKIGGIIGDVAGDKLDGAGEVIMGGAQEAHSFLATVQRIVDTIKVFFSNLINTIFPFFNIGEGNSLFG